MRCNGKIQLYPCLRLALMLIVGIIVGRMAYPVTSWHYWCGGSIVALFLALLLREKISQTAMTFLSTFCFGAMITQHELSSLDIALPEGKIDYEAIVISQPTDKGKTITCDLLVTDGVSSSPVKVKARILKDTLTERYRNLRIGDGIIAYGTMEKPQSYSSSNNFDYPLWMQSHGFVAQTFITYDNWEVVPANMERLGVGQRLQVKALISRDNLLEKLSQKGIDGQEMAIVAAMALGEKSMISQETRDAYAVTGVSHVLALSGLHLGILFQVIMLLAGGNRRRLFNTAISLLAIWAYAIFVGMPTSVLRASVMISVYSMVNLLRRDSLSVNSLSVAVLLMLTYNPLYLYDISFQLSVMAVMSISIYYPMFYRKISIQWLMTHRFAKWAWSLFCVSIAAQIGTAPISAYYFERISCYTLVANFIAIPVATLILYLTLVTIVCNPVTWLCQLTGKLLSLLANFMNEALRFMSAFPGASIDNVNITFPQLVLVYVIIAAVTMLYSKTSSIMKSSTATLSVFSQAS